MRRNFQQNFDVLKCFEVSILTHHKRPQLKFHDAEFHKNRRDLLDGSGGTSIVMGPPHTLGWVEWFMRELWETVSEIVCQPDNRKATEPLGENLDCNH